MKMFMFLICFIFTAYYKNYNNKIIGLEGELFYLYKDNFRCFLSFDDQYNLIIDKNKFWVYFEEKGYEIDILNDYNLKFKIKFSENIEKEYYFYLVKNNE